MEAVDFSRKGDKLLYPSFGGNGRYFYIDLAIGFAADRLRQELL
ncbi:MAG: hypothetical protein CM1200mP12_22600 [Gammaproteobacteria bacterium]|nr:MAG: hypothetical protein CM1200mP12_22600 [Gammaproteobacteria bacterium]